MRSTRTKEITNNAYDSKMSKICLDAESRVFWKVRGGLWSPGPVDRRQIYFASHVFCPDFFQLNKSLGFMPGGVSSEDMRTIDELDKVSN